MTNDRVSKPPTSGRPKPVVAIDGPAGAGKSTVSRRVAEALGYMLLDTGALYRCVGLQAKRTGALGDSAAIGDVARELASQHAIRFQNDALGEQRVLLFDEDVSEEIRTNELSTLASEVSAISAVREALLEIQRDVGRDGSVVVEGRDIGTVVFPDAEAKFFLTASVERRATRRYEELKSRNEDTSLEEVVEAVKERDRRDSNRPVAPLKRASDALLVDSTELDVDDVVQTIVQQVLAIAASLPGRA